MNITAYLVKEIAECVQWMAQRKHLRRWCVLQREKCHRVMSIRTKERMAGRAACFRKDSSSFFFLFTFPISSCPYLYVVKKCCLLGINRWEFMKLDAVQGAAAVE